MVPVDILPIDLLATKCANLHEGRKAVRIAVEVCAEARRKVIEKWKER